MSRMADITLKLDLTDPQFTLLLDMLKPSTTPGPAIERWLQSIPPSTLEQLWLTSTADFSTPKGEGFRAALINRLHSDESLWA